MCTDDGFASGWEVITAVRRFQHRMEVFMDQSLEPLGITFAQYRALEAIDLNRRSTSPSSHVPSAHPTAAQTTVPSSIGGLVDLVPEPGRVYVRPSELGFRRLRLFRKYTHDFKLKLEEGSRERVERCSPKLIKPCNLLVSPSGGSRRSADA